MVPVAQAKATAKQPLCGGLGATLILNRMRCVCVAHRTPRVVAAAGALARHWQELGGLGGVPFAVPAFSSANRLTKGPTLPSAHLMAPINMPNAAYPPANPAGNGAYTSGGMMGQLAALQQGNDQRSLQHTDSRSSVHSHATLGASQSAGSSELGDR